MGEETGYAWPKAEAVEGNYAARVALSYAWSSVSKDFSSTGESFSVRWSRPVLDLVVLRLDTDSRSLSDVSGLLVVNSSDASEGHVYLGSYGAVPIRPLFVRFAHFSLSTNGDYTGRLYDLEIPKGSAAVEFGIGRSSHGSISFNRTASLLVVVDPIGLAPISIASPPLLFNTALQYVIRIELDAIHAVRVEGWNETGAMIVNQSWDDFLSQNADPAPNPQMIVALGAKLAVSALTIATAVVGAAVVATLLLLWLKKKREKAPFRR